MSVSAIQFSSKAEMQASYKATRLRLWTKPAPKLQLAPVALLVENDGVPERPWKLDFNAHVCSYCHNRAIHDYMDATGEYAHTNPIGKIFIYEIIKATSKVTGVSVYDIKSTCRTRTVIRPRQIAVYLARTLTVRSLPEIGRDFGGRHHTTIMHSVDKITAALPEYQSTIDAIMAELSGRLD